MTAYVAWRQFGVEVAQVYPMSPTSRRLAIGKRSRPTLAFAIVEDHRRQNQRRQRSGPLPVRRVRLRPIAG